MTKPDAEQLALFPEMIRPEPPPAPADKAEAPRPIRPWRALRAKVPDGDPVEAYDVRELYEDLLERNRELMKALAIAEVPGDLPELVRFAELELPLVVNFILLKWEDVEDVELPEVICVGLETAEVLAEIRLRILESLPEGQRKRALAAESRVRARNWQSDLADFEFALGEALGKKIVEIEITAGDDENEQLPPGVLGLGDVEALTECSIQHLKSEQEERKLPRQCRLRTLLKGIPAVWLDAGCVALDIDPKPLKKRKEREAAIARTLLDPSRLHGVIHQKLTARERELVAFLLDKGGESPSAPVSRRFGRDDDDAWFWNETPPTSVLGRVRLHGLAFVGRTTRAGRSYRTVAIPVELRDPIRAALAAA